MKTCLVDECNNNILAKGMCNKHYLRMQRYGDVDHTTFVGGDDETRFWGWVAKTDTCWNWTGSKRGKGYGRFKLGTQPISAHRYAYSLVKGPIPIGLQLDHLCMNKLCVNPDHLEPVTNSENQYRAFRSRGAWPIQTRLPQDVQCVWCNKTFPAVMYERARYCSNSCKSKAKRAKEKLTQ